MLDARGKLYGDLSAVVATRTLAASVCSLLPDDDSSAISKVQLKELCKEKYVWPSDESMQPDILPGLPKNIAKNFMNTFYKEKGVALVRSEGLCLSTQVIF